jgi:hypothetical protein
VARRQRLLLEDVQPRAAEVAGAERGVEGVEGDGGAAADVDEDGAGPSPGGEAIYAPPCIFI